MIFISHRGNLYGQNKKGENKIDYIENALSLGFDVELDIWKIENSLYLGHDEPCDLIDLDWLFKNNNKIWIHCKNIDSLLFLKDKELNYFWHENDKVTLTSKGFIWAYPSKNKIKNSIDVLPEISADGKYNFETLGICSDYIQKYKNDYELFLRNN